MTMPQIDENRQRGNFAESIASAWLSRQCLVRPVAAGTDIGVDLYCESLRGHQAFQHFWVQVKAISDTNVRTRDGIDEAWYSFETRHLRYWERQPVPVYAFLVPVLGWPAPAHSGDVDHLFRTMSTTCSEPCRPPKQNKATLDTYVDIIHSRCWQMQW